MTIHTQRLDRIRVALLAALEDQIQEQQPRAHLMRICDTAGNAYVFPGTDNEAACKKLVSEMHGYEIASVSYQRFDMMDAYELAEWLNKGEQP